MKHVYLTAALVEVFCFGALLGGWSNIGKLIRDAGHFARECDNTTELLTDCKSQANSIARIYSISQSTLGVGIFCFGLLYDRIEVFYSRLILSTCLTLAFLALALIDVVFPDWIMYVCWPVIQCSGVCLAIANFHLASYFPSTKSTIIATINGMSQASVMQSMIMSTLFRNYGWNLNKINGMYAALTSLLWVNTFFTLPRRRTRLADNDKRLLEGEESTKKELIKVKLLTSPLVGLLGLLFFIGSLRVYTGTGLTYDYVFYQTKNDTTNTSPSHDLDREMDLFVLIMSILVPVSSPLIGIAVDTVHKRTKDSTKTMLTGCTVIYSALIVYSLAVFVNTNVGRWCSYSLLSIAKSFVFNGNCVLIGLTFPLDVFGTVNGITEIFSTLAGLLLTLLNKVLITSEMWHLVFTCFTGALVACFLFTIFILVLIQKNMGCVAKLDQYRQSVIE